MYTNSNTSSPVPCTQSIDAAMMSIPRNSTVKRSASLSVSDFEEISVNTPLSPSARSRGSSLIGIGSKKKSLTASLSAGSDYPTAHTKAPYMLVKCLFVCVCVCVCACVRACVRVRNSYIAIFTIWIS